MKTSKRVMLIYDQLVVQNKDPDYHSYHNPMSGVHALVRAPGKRGTELGDANKDGRGFAHLIDSTVTAPTELCKTV